jgi:predicted RNA-binding Zn-ribbon protein involved in translation (DUF1610 family)
MSTTTFATAVRMAIWLGHAKKCFYCSEIIDFVNLDIDHLIAETTSASRLQDLVKTLALPADFQVNHLQNLVPAHRFCNGRKSNLEFSEENLRFYLEISKRRLPNVEAQSKRLNRPKRNETLLTAIAAQIDAEELSIEEVILYLTSLSRKARKFVTEPLVVRFGLKPDASGVSPRPSGEEIEKLIHELQHHVPCLSVRLDIPPDVAMAFWNMDVQHLDRIPLDNWRVTELQYYSDALPEKSWQELFPNAVIDTYHSVIRNESDRHFGVARCPTCGNTALIRRGTLDSQHDEYYYTIECKKCGWFDWTQ